MGHVRAMPHDKEVPVELQAFGIQLHNTEIYWVGWVSCHEFLMQSSVDAKLEPENVFSNKAALYLQLPGSFQARYSKILPVLSDGTCSCICAASA